MLVEGSFGSQLKRLLVGKLIPSPFAHQQRLSRPIGLALLSPDASSPVADATEELLGAAPSRTLTPGGDLGPFSASPGSLSVRLCVRLETS